MLAANAAAGLNAPGLLLAALAMRPGCPSVPLDERLAYLASHPPGRAVGRGVCVEPGP